MIGLSLAEVASLCSGSLEPAGWTDEIAGVQIDSRRIEEGDLFVAIGAGIDFRRHAFARGAAATLVPDDENAALAALGGAVRDRSPARVVGITGSTGKTSTKDILAAICEPRARTIAAEASFNNELGVPLTLCRLEADTEVCILELAMRGLGQIGELARIARPDLGVITNVGPAHLELVGDLAAVIRAKSELLDALPAGGLAIVPESYPVERDDLEILRFGEPEAHVADGRTVIRFDGRDVDFSFSARHQARNALAALLATRALGLTVEGSVEVSFGRWRGDESPLPDGGLLINDCYNANPLSMRAALEHLAERGRRHRLIAVLGDMAELGPTAPVFHREVGEHAAAVGVDVLLGIGLLAKNYVDGAPTIVARQHAETLEQGLAMLDGLLEPGDCVLVKASRAMGFEAIADHLTAVPAA